VQPSSLIALRCITQIENLLVVFVNVSEPDIPRLSSITNVEQRSVDLDWNLGATEVINKSVVSYVDQESMSSQMTTETTNHLSGLSPGRTYLFYLQVTSFSKTVQSSNYTFTTREFVTGLLLL